MLPTTKYDIGNDMRCNLTTKLEGVLNASTDKSGAVGVVVTASHRDMVEKLFKKDDDQGMMLLHAVMGIAGEAGELVDAIKKHVFFGKELDKENVVEELGDILFYLEAMAQLLNVSKTQLMAHNVDKLLTGEKARHKSGKYSDEAQNARADKQGEQAPEPWGAKVSVDDHQEQLKQAVPPMPPAVAPETVHREFDAAWSVALKNICDKASAKYDAKIQENGELWRVCRREALIAGLGKAVTDNDWASVVNYATMLDERTRIPAPHPPYEKPGVGR